MQPPYRNINLQVDIYHYEVARLQVACPPQTLVAIIPILITNHFTSS